MGNWYPAETPFGPILYTVHADGTTAYFMAGDDTTPYTDPYTGDVLTVPNHDRDNRNHGQALTVNGKAYLAANEMQGAVWKPAAGERPAAVWFDYPHPFTSAAYAKLSDWFTANWHTLASPIRIAAADVHGKKYAAHRASVKLADARTAYTNAQRELTAAEARLWALTPPTTDTTAPAAN